jgi:hypothetical protein
MGLDDPADQIQLSGPEAVIPGKPKWIDPKLTGPVLTLDVNVRWLIAVEAREEVPERPGKIRNSRH